VKRQHFRHEADYRLGQLFRTANEDALYLAMGMINQRTGIDVPSVLEFLVRGIDHNVDIDEGLRGRDTRKIGLPHCMLDAGIRGPA